MFSKSETILFLCNTGNSGNNLFYNTDILIFIEYSKCYILLQMLPVPYINLIYSDIIFFLQNVTSVTIKCNITGNMYNNNSQHFTSFVTSVTTVTRKCKTSPGQIFLNN